MKIHNVEQGSLEWIAARIGIPTASCFDKIVTPGGKLSTQADKYAYRLIAESLLKRQLDSLDGLEWIERGKELEGEAVRLYEFKNEVETKKVGFITTDDGQIGASPDRLISPTVGMECKCPSPQVHVGYFLGDLGDKYKCQVQGQNFVGEFEYSVFFSYHPEFPPVTIKTPRDEPFIKLLRDALNEFNNRKADMMERVRVNGFFVERERILTATDNEYGEMLNMEGAA